MPVRDAVSTEDFEKIVEFLNVQPEDSLWNRCYRGVIRERTVEWLELCKEQKPYWHLFYVTDKRGKIRAIATLEERGQHPKEPKIVANIMMLMEQKDVDKQDYRFAFELLREMAKWCIDNGFYTAEYVLRDIDIPFIHKPSTKIVREIAEARGHKIYLCQVDIEKFLGLA